MDCARQQSGARYHWLQTQRRLHVNHGPIDLIIEIDGAESERARAFAQAMAFFDSVLADLVVQLVQLRKPASTLQPGTFDSVVAQHMHDCVQAFAAPFITPMAAVAGSVADCTLAALCQHRHLQRALVNNGGDIAFYLTPGSSYTVGICDHVISAQQSASARIESQQTVRGVATSGWQGRSHSMGIADAVTVLASCAGIADAAATLIANQVTLPGSEKIQSVAASELTPDSDLGNRLVTVAVQPLTQHEKHLALSSAHRYAQTLVARGLIDSAFLSLQGQQVVTGDLPLIQQRESA